MNKCADIKMCNIMEKMLFFVLFFFVARTRAENILYHLPDDDYYRMPVKNHLDRYDPCVKVTGGVYCTSSGEFVSDQPSELLDMMRAYSAFERMHYNYSLLIYGLCLTKRCKQFYDGDPSLEAMTNASEACLNHTLSREYGLKARVNDVYCARKDQHVPKDTLDYAVLAFFLFWIGLHVAGTIYDKFIRDRSQKGNKFLMAFAFEPNWQAMVAPPSKNPHQQQLMSMHGVRTLTSIIIIMGHAPMASIISADNTRWLEATFEEPLTHILIQGHLVMQTFFLLSGFLLTYNLELKSEKLKYSWRRLPNLYISRMLRLAPVSWTILIVTVTWIRHGQQGPMWKLAIGQEADDCRTHWLHNALLINNMNDKSTCNMPMWSTAADMQMHLIGLTVMMLASRSARPAILALLYLVALAWPTYLIYSQDLVGTMLASPATIANFFMSSPTFHQIYKPALPNLPSFIIGMACGLYVYNLQKKDQIKGDYTHLRWAYYLLVLAIVLLPMSAYFVFVREGAAPSLLTRILFPAIVKPLFAALVMTLIFGAMYKVEGLVRGLLESPFWMMLSRISYCMYAVHVSIARYLGGTTTTLPFFSQLHTFQEYTGTLLVSIVFAIALYLIVELPCSNLVKSYIEPSAVKLADKSGLNDAPAAEQTKITSNGALKKNE